MKPEKRNILPLLSIILSIAVICLAVIQILGIWENAILVFEPLGGILLLLQGIQFWEKNRKAAIFQFCAAVFVFLVTVVVYFS